MKRIQPKFTFRFNKNQEIDDLKKLYYVFFKNQKSKIFMKFFEREYKKVDSNYLVFII